ncbi:MAG: SPOR domain-containing protein [Cyclobacteriaceae bacterium]
MAKKKKKDEEPKDQQNEQFEDDDFGLPDLEYGELDDDEFSDEMEMPSPVDLGEPEEESKPADEIKDTSSEDIGDSIEGMDIDDIDMDDLDLDDLDIDDIEISDEELQKELAQMESEGFDISDADDESSEVSNEPPTQVDVQEEKLSMDNVFETADKQAAEIKAANEEESKAETPSEPAKTEPEFYEEESFEEFEEEIPSIFDADSPGEANVGSNIGQPKEQVVFEKVVPDYKAQKKARGNFAKIAIIGTVSFILAAVLIVWLMGNGESEKPVEVAKVEKKEPVLKPVETPPAEPANEGEEANANRRKRPTKNSTPPATVSSVTPGEIKKLESQTGNSYIVIASFVDEDLAMDHAKDLASQGKGPIIIPPFAKHIFWRVAIEEFTSISDATANIERLKAEYGTEIWPLKY